jgi:hypothetical protein
MHTTLTILVQESLLELLESFGEPTAIAPAALRQYLVDRCLHRIEQAEDKIAFYEKRYHADYETFNRRVATDESYLAALNHEHPLWEADASEWAYRLEEAVTWRERLQKALQISSPSLALS